MPIIRLIVAASTTDALATKDFNQIPPESGGAMLSVYGAAVTKTDSFGLNCGTRVVIPTGTNLNIESSADVIDNDRDGLMFSEWVPPGKLTMPVTVTTEAQFLLIWNPVNRY